MKKLSLIMVSIIMLMGLASCGGNTSSTTTTTSGTGVQQVQQKATPEAKTVKKAVEDSASADVKAKSAEMEDQVIKDLGL